MCDTDLYASILGIVSPWRVTSVNLDHKGREVRVTIQPAPDTQLRCPTCDKPCPGYDSRPRSWRHLDTCQFKTILIADVPRVNCAEHAIQQIRVPWGKPGSRFTALMEALVIDWLKEASIEAVARLLRLSWDEIDDIMQRAVKRGLKRRRLGAMARLCVDETSFQKHHEYMTVVLDPERQAVVYVGDGRDAAALDAFWSTLTPEQIAAIEVVAMDLAKAYVSSTRKHVPDADRKIAFDRFHVASLINDAVNDVRKQEHRELTAQDEPLLKGTRTIWIKNPENHTEHEERLFRYLDSLGLKVGRACGLKEMARHLWQ